MRSAAAVIIALTLAALAGLAVAALTGDREQAFTLGVARAAATEVKPGRQLCQSPIAVPGDAAFDRVTFAVGTDHRPGPALDVTVRSADADRPDSDGGPVRARAAIPAGYPDVDRMPQHTVQLQRVGAGETIAVCISNRGRRPAFVYGDGDAAARTSSAFLDGVPTGTDVALEFGRDAPRSLASLLPAMLDRAALFRAQWVGPWAYWLLGLLVLVAVPALLVRAIRAAAAPDGA